MTEPDAPSLDQLLASAGAPGDLAPRVAATLGEQAAARLAADPWLILGVPGVRPEAADGFARSVLGGTAGPQDPRRARAVLGWLLDRAALDGHTAQPADVLCSALGQPRLRRPCRGAAGRAGGGRHARVLQRERGRGEARREPGAGTPRRPAAPPA